MKLNLQSLQDRTAWSGAAVALPEFDIAAMRAKTQSQPVWVHFGAGNIFRGFVARLQQQLLNAGLAEHGIAAADTFDYDIIDKIYAPHDNLTLLVSLHGDGSTEKEVIASVAEALRADSADAAHIGRLREIFCNPSLQMVSFTITEKGYAIANAQGEYIAPVRADIENGPQKAVHAMSVVAALMLARFEAGQLPIALVSMDNCSHNGEKLKAAVTAIADEWVKKGFAPSAFAEYLSDESRVSFPWSMIDKITPRPDPQIEADLAALGIEDMAPIVTGKNTFIAPFVNAEVAQYLVVEDRFPNGRPALEKAGVYFTGRDVVNQTERMKVTTCLNPLHTALAVFGCLLDYTRISDEMRDVQLKKLVERIGYTEGLPVVTHPGIIDPAQFIKEVLEQRFPNPYIPDTPQRIAVDTSQKVGIRFGETIKSYLGDPALDIGLLTGIPLAIAGWMRYLLGMGDDMAPIELSPDPLLEDMQARLSGIEAGKPESYAGQLRGILCDKTLFGSDLCATPLADKIETLFIEMLAGPGAVRATLIRHLGE